MAKSFLNMGGYPLGFRNNNPGNIRPGDNWQGATGTNAGFVVFQDMSFGIRALGTDLRTKIDRGYDTISAIIYRYAPPSENDTGAYIESVSDDTGVPPSAKLTADRATLHKLVRAIINHENGNSYSALLTDADIKEGLDKMSGGGMVGPVGFSVATGLFLFSLYLLATMPKSK